ncbi:MAG: hypothetical protein WCG13_03660 [Burkholderiales bacterium]|jgi:hypothetical protein
MASSAGPGGLLASAGMPEALMLVDAVIAFTLLETVALLAWHRYSGRGIAPRPLLSTMASGLTLMAALRAVTAGAPWPWLVGCLMAAGVAHAIDLRVRWRG